jgi:Na+-transporting methylmalonyl-CoA/oxaloacetate decarboxylase gamma subunit
MRLRTNQFYFAIALLVSLCALPAPAQGQSTAGDYAKRLAMAERLVNEAVERNGPSWELAPMTSEVKRLLPASEEVEFNGAITRVDNAWFHEAMNNLVKTAGGDDRRRVGMLSEISARLARLRESVKAALTAEDRAEQDQRARLDRILARAAYQNEEKRESSLERWFRQILDSILRLLVRLFGGAASRAPRTGVAGFVLILRALIFLVVIAALTYGAVKLVQRFQPRPKQPKEPEAREALGEEIAEDATADELFATASELARRGEYRKAIRRAYIALLCDFDQRGKLRLGRSKTNRDYLDAVRSERRIYATFSLMTFAFERAWYGQQRATEEEFRNFAELYREAIK